MLNTSRTTFILLQDWPRHRRECLATSTMSSAPYELVAGTVSLTPQLVTVTGLLFSPEQGQSSK